MAAVNPDSYSTFKRQYGYTVGMRLLRRQLIELLDQARKQHGLEEMDPRLMAALVEDFLALLPKGKEKPVGIQSRTLTHGKLHRHVFTIRCPDQAFYLDAIKGYLYKHGIQPINQQTMVAKMSCDESGCALELQGPGIEDKDNFMFIALHISATLTPDKKKLLKDFEAILHAVNLSVRDFHPMRRFIGECVAHLMRDDPEAASLLDWINDNHYLYFGLTNSTKRLGITTNARFFGRVIPGLAGEITRYAKPKAPGISWLSLAASHNHLYSAGSTETLRICWRNYEGELDHAVVIGHFSRSAHFTNASYLPMLSAYWRRLTEDDLLQHSAFYRREIRTLFDRIPKRILFFTRPNEWLAPLKSVIDLAGPAQSVIRLLPSLEGNSDTLMIALTVDRFGQKIMQHILQALKEKGIGTHGFESFGIGPHRLIFIGVDRAARSVGIRRISDAVRSCIIFWKDHARAEVLRHADILDIPSTLKELEGTPPLYQELFPPTQFARDIQMRRRVLGNKRTSIHVTPRPKAERESVELHIYSLGQPTLGTLVDTIRAFGLDPVREAAMAFGGQSTTQDGDSRCIHISALICHTPKRLDNEAAKRLRRALALVLNDEADHDPVNALLITADLDIDEIAVLITLRNHLIQLLPDAAKLPLTEMMLRHPKVAAALHMLFVARHLPGMPADFLNEARREFHAALQTVASLSDDRWFRALAELVEASLRTNAFIRTTGTPVVIKIESQRLGFLPHPRPHREIFVHGTHVEGVHLRAGPIARGGIRFSDRPADFRTEVLELMSTQTIKNGQIVPTGSKGGFVVRGGSGSLFVQTQYRNFIRSLLALTDNLVAGEAAAPEGVLVPEHDRNDPYLVVAADKGTAHFSDAANEEALQAGFWLGDAFASGGKTGYDHKAIGITARGAWVCAAHHLSRLGIDAWSDPISCVGIGDMSGDVFGNGMLLNANIQLIAAFNHRHIFLDPNPDSGKAFAERQRLFAAGSDWDGYNKQLISRGGGVFERSAKSIPLAEAARRVLGVDEEALSGEALIQAILAAPVELLYNGGIGTYVKASSEGHSEARDPANNAVRIDANQLRCRVVCEGGNLGFTQKARIEFAKVGGAINTDAMDNSAGVDLSDHEVNLKTLFAAMPAEGMSLNRRNRLLKGLVDDVARQCLEDNLLQSMALTLAEDEAAGHLPRYQRLRDNLIESGWLNPAVAPLIDNNELLTLRPQLSILLGQEKNRIHARLSADHFHQRSNFGDLLLRHYFPPRLASRFKESFAQHPLAAEIIHTQATNHVVNHLGLGAVHHLESLLDVAVDDIVEALLIAEALLDIAPLRHAIWEQAENMATATLLQRALQDQLMLFTENLLRLCHVGALDQAWISRQQKGLRQFHKHLTGQGLEALAGQKQQGIMAAIGESGLDEKHALQLAALPQLAQSACAVHLSSSLKQPLSRCLKASRACLKLLPIDEMEAPLRTPDWGSEDAHKLRREWLRRLTLMQSRAITQLLDGKTDNFERTGKELWQAHRYWERLQQFRQEVAAGEPGSEKSEAARMRLLLAMARLEAVIDRT